MTRRGRRQPAAADVLDRPEWPAATTPASGTGLVDQALSCAGLAGDRVPGGDDGSLARILHPPTSPPVDGHVVVNTPNSTVLLPNGHAPAAATGHLPAAPNGHRPAPADGLARAGGCLPVSVPDPSSAGRYPHANSHRGVSATMPPPASGHVTAHGNGHLPANGHPPAPSGGHASAADYAATRDGATQQPPGPRPPDTGLRPVAAGSPTNAPAPVGGAPPAGPGLRPAGLPPAGDVLPESWRTTRLPPPPVPPAPFGQTTVDHAVSVPRTGLPGFDENPFLLAHRSAIGTPATRRGRPRLSLSFRFVAVLALLVAGFVLYRVTHPSVHRSPTAVAIDFYTQLEHSSFAAAAHDVEPAQQSAAATGAVTPQIQAFVRGSLGHDLVEAGTTTPNGADTIVVLQTCGRGLSCNPALAVPTVQIAGSWYVDWNTWLQGVPPEAS